jgi:hypothetical protein
MNQDTKTYAVYEAIAAITGELAKVGIAKGRKNTQQGYQFRGIDDVYSSLSSLLAANKLCVIPRVLSRSVTERETQKGGVLFYAIVDVEFDLVSALDGSQHTARIVGEAMDTGDKATNKAMSAAYKYFALQTFCIPTEGDNDADAQTHEVTALAPPPDLGKNIPLEQARITATHMRGILEEDTEEQVKCLHVADLHDTLKTQQDLYVAASDQMSSKEKSAWRAYLAMAKKAMQSEPSPNGRRF